jgi:hypothetical protein
MYDQGMNNLFTIVVTFLEWIEISPMSMGWAQSGVESLMRKWVMRWMGGINNYCVRGHYCVPILREK